MYLGEQWMDVLNLVTPEPRVPNDPSQIWVMISPELLYQKSKEHILGRIRNSNPPDGQSLSYCYSTAKRLTQQYPHIWDNLQISCDPRRLDPKYRQIRYEALETLRIWFTEFLHRALDLEPGIGLGLKITPADHRFRL